MTPAARALAALDGDGAFDFPDEMIAHARAAIVTAQAWVAATADEPSATPAELWTAYDDACAVLDTTLDALITALDDEGVDDGGA